MSSHREAPEIASDPVADNTDVYAFVSPDKSDTVTILANYIPLQGPAGGPNFFSFGDDVLYEIHIDNNGDAKPDITYQFRFQTQTLNPNTFLYNTGPITALDSKNWNRPASGGLFCRSWWCFRSTRPAPLPESSPDLHARCTRRQWHQRIECAHHRAPDSQEIADA